MLPLSSVPLHRGEKCAAYLFTPPMVLALAMMVWSTRYYINVPFFHQAAYAFFLHRGYCRLCLLIQPAKGLRPPPDVKGGAYGAMTDQDCMREAMLLARLPRWRGKCP